MRLWYHQYMHPKFSLREMREGKVRDWARGEQVGEWTRGVSGGMEA